MVEKIIGVCAVVGLLLIGGAQVSKAIEPVKSVIVPDSVEVSLDSNALSVNYENAVSGVLPIENKTDGIVQVKITSIEPVGGSGSPTVVEHGKYTDAEWMNLTQSTTANNIAFGVVPVAGTGWNRATTDNWVVPGASTTLGVIGEYGKVGFWLKAKYGLSYGGSTQLSYKINYELVYLKEPTIPVTGVSISNNNPKPGNVLQANVLPSVATVNYEWRVNGSLKSTNSNYTVQTADAGYTVTLKVTGKDKFSGTASASSNKVTIPVTGLRLNTTSPNVGSTLYPTVTPSGATVDYEWRVNGSLRSTSSSYTVQSSDVGYTVSLKVTGNGIYSGTTSVSTNSVANPLISIYGAYISGSASSGNTLYAGISPSGATVSYSWYKDGYYVGSGSSYRIPSGSGNSQIRVEVTGYGNYTGSDSAYVNVAPDYIPPTKPWMQSLRFDRTPTVGQTVHVGVTPNNCTGSYSWYVNGSYVGSGTYVMVQASWKGKTLRCDGSAYGDWQGSASVSATVR